MRRAMSALAVSLTLWMYTSCSAISTGLEQESSDTTLRRFVPPSASNVVESPLEKETYSAHRTVSFTTLLSQSAYQNWLKAQIGSNWHLRKGAPEDLFVTRLLEGEQQTITFACDVQPNGENHVRILFTAIPTLVHHLNWSYRK